MRLPLWVLRLMHRHHLSRRRMHGGRLHSWFGDRLIDKALWRPTRESLARAWLVGFPITVVPFLPLQSVIAVIAALCVRGNILLCIALQFLSTPLTAPVHLPACYVVGEVLRGRDLFTVWEHVKSKPLALARGDTVVSLYLGAVFIGFLGGAIGYAVIHRTWRHPHRRPRGSRPPPASPESRSPHARGESPSPHAESGSAPPYGRAPW